MAGRPPLTPEELASCRAWRFGSTLDWASLILTEIDYPVEENRWFVDAACGIYQRIKLHYDGAGVPITHSALAKRAGKFKNKAQASELARRAIDRDAEWARLKRMLVLDVERPTPAERRGRDKRAATKYTDYLTPAAVWAQGCEQTIKKANPAAWKSSKYRGEKRAEILAEAVKMLPEFRGAAEDELPTQMREPRCRVCEAEAKQDGDDSPRYKKDCPGHPQTLSERVQAEQAKEDAARRRMIDILAGEHLTDTDEIDARIKAVTAYYAREKAELERECKAALKVLSGMRATRLVTPIRFTDPEETASAVDAKIGTAAGETGPATWLQDDLFTDKKGNAGVTLVVPDESPPLPPPSPDGKRLYKGSPEVSG
jgi:hypothetical protein